MSPKTGNFFPARDDRESSVPNCAAIVARALQSELGDSHRAAKTLMRWTGANERTVKHWLSGRHAPRSDHLIVLLRKSDAVFEGLMIAAGRSDAAIAAHVLSVQTAIDELLVLMTGRGSRSGTSDQKTLGDNENGRVTDRSRVRRDREKERELDREEPRDRAARSPAERQPSPRQRWFLAALRSGLDVRAADMKARWGISEKTARRDLAALKDQDKIVFRGSCKAGRYHVNS